MVKKLLAERFWMTFHHEKRELSVYAITVGKSGPKLTKSVGELIGMPSQDADQHGTELDMRFKNMSMADFGFCMQFFLDRPIVARLGFRVSTTSTCGGRSTRRRQVAIRMPRRDCLRRCRSSLG